MTKPVDWLRLQAEVGTWSLLNFGNEPPHMQVLGVIEELGELEQAMAVYAVTPPRERYASRPAVEDAAGDTMIFIADYCARQNHSLEVVVEVGRRLRRVVLPVVQIMGKLAHHQLKWEQRIRLEERHDVAILDLLSDVVAHLDHTLCFGRFYPLDKVVMETWAQVRKRNWVANPETGTNA